MTDDAVRRVQLSRAKGWRMPPNTVKVDRTTKWGNPFPVGFERDATAAACVYWYTLMVCGYIRICNRDRQAHVDAAWETLKAEIKAGYPALRGKNLACWCPIGKPCHADILIFIANRQRGQRVDVDKILAGYGYRVDNGLISRLEIANG